MSDTAGPITIDELQLATRNHGMPLEALRWPLTPIGLHYVLVHYDIPLVDERSWSLEIVGGTAGSTSLSLEDLAGRPRHTVTMTMECAGNGRALLEPRPLSQPWLIEAVGTAAWSGTRLGSLLEEAGVPSAALEVVFTGIDQGVEGGIPQHYERSLPLTECLRDDVIVADEMNGSPLPPQHGFPLRLIVPGWYGMTNVKWLTKIAFTTEAFTGYQQQTAYRLRQHVDEDGTPLTRMLPRAVMVPPGVPEFMTRDRHIAQGTHIIEGRAWSGEREIEAVEMSPDGGAHWFPAKLDDPRGDPPWFWRRWSWMWDAEPGEYMLCCRARDAAGAEQPTDPRWNVHGYANNAVQRVAVSVQPRPVLEGAD